MSLSVRHVCVTIGLAEPELLAFVEREWVRPAREGGEPRFADVDVARVRLILELRDAMAVGEEAMPVVLDLMDRLYDERRRMRRLCEAIRASGLTDRVRHTLLPES